MLERDNNEETTTAMTSEVQASTPSTRNDREAQNQSNVIKKSKLTSRQFNMIIFIMSMLIALVVLVLSGWGIYSLYNRKKGTQTPPSVANTDSPISKDLTIMDSFIDTLPVSSPQLPFHSVGDTSPSTRALDLSNEAKEASKKAGQVHDKETMTRPDKNLVSTFDKKTGTLTLKSNTQGGGASRTWTNVQGYYLGNRYLTVQVQEGKKKVSALQLWDLQTKWHDDVDPIHQMTLQNSEPWGFWSFINSDSLANEEYVLVVKKDVDQVPLKSQKNTEDARKNEEEKIKEEALSKAISQPDPKVPIVIINWPLLPFENYRPILKESLNSSVYNLNMIEFLEEAGHLRVGATIGNKTFYWVLFQLFKRRNGQFGVQMDDKGSTMEILSSKHIKALT